MLELLQDPNVVYLVLMFGLWATVTAAHVVGTGIGELLALVGLGTALYLLTTMPTQWPAVLVVIVGVLSFATLPWFGLRYAWYAVAALVGAGVASLFLFVGESVSAPLVAVTTLVALAYHRLALVPRLALQTAAPSLLNDHVLTGLRGVVRSPLTPVGTVYVQGETWTARADENIASGTEIVVIAQEGLTLHVEPFKRKGLPADHSEGS
jgi:membrane-bound serine protease (ClpP class)